MSITLKCFAFLNQYLPGDTSGNTVTLDIAENTTVQQLIHSLGIDTDMVELAILNDVFIDPRQRGQTQLKQGDTLALWPEVAGG